NQGRHERIRDVGGSSWLVHPVLECLLLAQSCRSLALNGFEPAARICLSQGSEKTADCALATAFSTAGEEAWDWSFDQAFSPFASLGD
ncbi:hypothetical protein, partial [Ciceribacter azotifigens]|uniref:hypothetical protein n=1 Tax=Ciceribacter azotifigens TaxID=2069303 RepID=UPI003A869FBF